MIREISLDEWKLKHPRASKNYPDFFVDFKPEGSKIGEHEVPYTYTAIRLLVLQRDNDQCRACKTKDSDTIDDWYKGDFKGYSRGNCEVQHIIPKKNGGSSHPTNLITLCRRCHVSTFRHGYKGIPSVPEGKQTTLLAKVAI